MEMTKVESSNIEAIGYETDVLYIQFKTGDLYSYSPVTEEMYNELMAAESKGKYFAANIKRNSKIAYQKIHVEKESTLSTQPPKILAGKGVIKDRI